jgi:hypothetical protein
LSQSYGLRGILWQSAPCNHKSDAQGTLFHKQSLLRAVPHEERNGISLLEQTKIMEGFSWKDHWNMEFGLFGSLVLIFCCVIQSKVKLITNNSHPANATGITSFDLGGLLTMQQVKGPE